MDMISSKLVYLDLFGFKPRLYFKGYSHSFTKIGLFFSISLVIFSNFCFFYFGQDLYYKRNPTVIYNEDFISLPYSYQIDPELDPIIIEINNPDGSIFYSDPKLLKVTVSQISLIKSKDQPPKLTIDNYNMEICTENHFTNVKNKVAYDWFLNRNLKDYFCIPHKIKNLTIEGAFDQEIYKAVRFGFHLCKNESFSDVVCESLENIKKIMQSGFFGIYFLDNIIDPGEYKSFIKNNPHEVFSNWDISSSKELSIFFKSSYVYTDDGLISENEKFSKIRNYDGEANFHFNQEKENFILIDLRMSHKQSIYRRKYEKIQTFFAQIGGFINCFWILGFILNYLNSHLIFIRDVVKDVFSIKELNQDDIKTLLGKKIKTSNTVRSNKIFNLDMKLNENSNKVNDNVKGSSNELHESVFFSLLKSRKPKEKALRLNMDFIDTFHFYTGLFSNPERQQKRAIINKGIKIIKEHLDVKFIIQKFFDIEKLKHIVLNDKQIQLFNTMGKPQLELNMKKNKIVVDTNVLTRKKSKLKKFNLEKHIL